MSRTEPDLPADVGHLIEAWLDAHDQRAPGLIAGLYLVGSLALGDRQPRSDIDAVAVTSRVPGRADIELLRRARRDVPVAIDGPYLHPGDLTSAPRPLVRAWTLGGEFHHDDGCFEINPVTWATIARHPIVARGPDPRRHGVVDDPAAVRDFVIENTITYWSAVADMVADALSDPDRHAFSAETTEWCVLGVARMVFTARTGDIASKSGAGRWFAGEFPASAEVIDRAIAIRSSDDPEPVDRATTEATLRHLRHSIDVVTAPPVSGDVWCAD